MDRLAGRHFDSVCIQKHHCVSWDTAWVGWASGHGPCPVGTYTAYPWQRTAQAALCCAVLWCGVQLGANPRPHSTKPR